MSLESASEESFLDLAAAHIGAVWAGTTVLVLAVFFGVDPLETVVGLIEEQGVSDAQQQAVAFVAGFTLPLAVGVAGIVLAYARGWMADQSGPSQLLICAFVLAATGFLSSAVGLGLAPDIPDRMVSGPIYVALPLTVLGAYLTSYGFPLFLCGAAIGFAAGVQAHRWGGAVPKVP